MSKKGTNINVSNRGKSSNRSASSINRRIGDDTIIQYVLPLGNGWVVKGSNMAKFTVITDSKKEAVRIARNLAQNKHSDLIVHGRNGAIELKESYVL